MGMSQATSDILTQAVGRNSAAVLSLPSAGMVRHFKSRFLNETPEGVWLESIGTEHPLIEGLIADGQSCGISFKSSDQKVSFTAKVLKLDPEYRINETTILPAVMIDRPAEVKTIQRRNNYRVRVPAEFELTVQLWRIPERFHLKDKPPRAGELALILRDISIGGLGVTLLPQDGQPPKILDGERLRVAIKAGADEELIVEGRICSLRAGEGPGVPAGIQFLKLQDGLEGRQVLDKLTKIIGAMQREEVRRRRLGLAG
jgi:c-di-GMP-binding flagellar brake protein YcgR